MEIKDGEVTIGKYNKLDQTKSTVPLEMQSTVKCHIQCFYDNCFVVRFQPSTRYSSGIIPDTEKSQLLDVVLFIETKVVLKI